jgi:hypothetical protein
MPTAAVTQIDAAVVSPRMRFWPGFWTITPAPRKPMPVTMPCTARETSAFTESVWLEKPIAAMVARHAPSATSPSVFMPVGLPCRARSMPMMQPIRTALSMRITTSMRTG